MATTEPIRDKKDLEKLANYFRGRGELRNYAMIVVGTCTALRISDLLKLKWSDVIHLDASFSKPPEQCPKARKSKPPAIPAQTETNSRPESPYPDNPLPHLRFKTHVFVSEQKTGKQKLVALNDSAKLALREYYAVRVQSDYIFAAKRSRRPITRQYAWLVIRDAAAELGIDGVISCHSLRKTWGYHAWTEGNISPAVITEIYNHSSYEVTKRYLGIEQDDLDAAYLKMKLF